MSSNVCPKSLFSYDVARIFNLQVKLRLGPYAFTEHDPILKIAKNGKFPFLETFQNKILYLKNFQKWKIFKIGSCFGNFPKMEIFSKWGPIF